MFPATILSLLSNACPAPIPGPATRAGQDWVPHPAVRECQLHKGRPGKAADGYLSGSVSVYGQRRLPVRNAWELSPEPQLLAAAPTDISRTRANVVAGWALGVLIMIAWSTSAITLRSFEKTRLLLTSPKGYTACPRPHSNVTGSETESGPRALSLLGSTLGCLGFHGFTLYWWI